jgi:hypothetical protein
VARWINTRCAAWPTRSRRDEIYSTSGISKVEPRGGEPLTSAVQRHVRRFTTFIIVHEPA